MLTIALRTTTAFVFFLAAVGIFYASTMEESKSAAPALRPFAYSAFCVFVVLGPLGWIERSVVATPESTQTANGTVPVADLVSPSSAKWLRIGLLGGQLGCLAAGVGFPAFSFRT